MAESANLHLGDGNAGATLENKVAMLFNGSNEDGRSLAVSLASYGADIAIVYREGRAKHARETKKLVEAEGRRCLIVPVEAGQIVSKDLIRQTTNKLGRLDIFIDTSSLSGEANGPADTEGDTV
ncbi:MAG: hypothetical protein PVH18_10560 [Chloroflexota bacterium]|jgi:NAD(P)-dependent dehydrogenase (short-subunit alcohol dehydrogenase family)